MDSDTWSIVATPKGGFDPVDESHKFSYFCFGLCSIRVRSGTVSRDSSSAISRYGRKVTRPAGVCAMFDPPASALANQS